MLAHVLVALATMQSHARRLLFVRSLVAHRPPHAPVQPVTMIYYCSGLHLNIFQSNGNGWAPCPMEAGGRSAPSSTLGCEALGGNVLKQWSNAALSEVAACGIEHRLRRGRLWAAARQNTCLAPISRASVIRYHARSSCLGCLVCYGSLGRGGRA